MIVGGSILGLIVLWQVLGMVLGHGDEVQTEPPVLVTGATGALGSGDAPPAKAGTVTGTFPDQLGGSRLDVNVVALGTTPHDCTAQMLRTGGETLAVYHHRCPDEPHGDRYYFLLRMTNHAKGRVDVHLDGFTLEGANGNTREAFATPPVGSPSTRFIQGTRAIAEDQTLRGWVTFDGSGGFVPAALVYTDGKEILRIRFQGTWV